MEWPYRRFLKAYDAFQRRILCDEWRSRKVAHIAAMFANTNFDDERNDRNSVVERLEKSYDRLIAQMWNGPDEKTVKAEKQEWDSSFMRAGRRALGSLQPPSLPGEGQIEALSSG